MRRPAAVAAALLLLLLAGCSSPRAITSSELNAAVGPTFARLYQLQQRELGPTGSAAVPDGVAHCYRGVAASSVAADPNAGAAASVTATGAQSGPGDDWSCVVNYPFPDGHIQPIAYDLTVQATGCYSADGPTGVVGQQRIVDATGRTVTNPLFAFDGCVDIG